MVASVLPRRFTARVIVTGNELPWKSQPQALWKVFQILLLPRALVHNLPHQKIRREQKDPAGTQHTVEKIHADGSREAVSSEHLLPGGWRFRRFPMPLRA